MSRLASGSVSTERRECDGRFETGEGVKEVDAAFGEAEEGFGIEVKERVSLHGQVVHRADYERMLSSSAATRIMGVTKAMLSCPSFRNFSAACRQAL